MKDKEFGKSLDVGNYRVKVWNSGEVEFGRKLKESEKPHRHVFEGVRNHDAFKPTFSAVCSICGKEL